MHLDDTIGRGDGTKKERNLMAIARKGRERFGMEHGVVDMSIYFWDKYRQSK
jgi:hypothetical protein